ncbi:XRE family transcriptional regulator [Sporolactobacillus sp. CQH2019]|uniref:LexA family protein n=1 Tax=Sporolactobacillus sp. CQH2019 TaxID=3023512 RepID=UPI0023687E30|nr:XRE family transcriptional regulator [Sporolactobacillus sp. CQH2019]MDD9148126.1 XRE family transcriptional regulator [Sporolactobacillus sp. CQH2019]
MIISDRIKEMRLKRGFTLKQLAEAIGKTEATVQRYESGNIKNLKSDIISQIADVLHCAPAYLMGWSDVEQSDMDVKLDPRVKKIYVYGTVKAGPNGLAYEEVEPDPEFFDYEYIVGDYFALRVKGDSMIGDGINENDIVLVRETCEIAFNDQIGIAIVNGEEGTIKHIIKTENSLILRASNPNVKSREFIGEEMNKVRIVGVVVEMKRKFGRK